MIIRNEFVEKKNRTTVKLSQRGITEIDEYWATMDEIRGRMEQKKRRRFAGGRALPRPVGLFPASAS